MSQALERFRLQHDGQPPRCLAPALQHDSEAPFRATLLFDKGLGTDVGCAAARHDCLSGGVHEWRHGWDTHTHVRHWRVLCDAMRGLRAWRVRWLVWVLRLETASGLWRVGVGRLRQPRRRSAHGRGRCHEWRQEVQGRWLCGKVGCVTVLVGSECWLCGKVGCVAVLVGWECWLCRHDGCVTVLVGLECWLCNDVGWVGI